MIVTELSPLPCHETQVSSAKVQTGCWVGVEASGRGCTAAKANNSRINGQNLNRATKLSQHVRVLAAKLKDLSSVPRIHIVNRTDLHRLSPGLHKYAMS